MGEPTPDFPCDDAEKLIFKFAKYLEHPALELWDSPLSLPYGNHSLEDIKSDLVLLDGKMCELLLSKGIYWKELSNCLEKYSPELKYLKQTFSELKRNTTSLIESRQLIGLDAKAYLSKAIDGLGGLSSYRNILFRSGLAEIFLKYYQSPHRRAKPTIHQQNSCKAKAKELSIALRSSPFFEYQFDRLLEEVDRLVNIDISKSEFTSQQKNIATPRSQLILDAYEELEHDFFFDGLEKYRVPAELLLNIVRIVEPAFNDKNEVYKKLRKIKPSEVVEYTKSG